MIELVLEGRPVPWARARTRRGVHYTPPRQREHRNDLALMLIAAAKGKRFDGPVSLSVEFDYGKNETRIRIAEATGPEWMTSRPDVDNCLKQISETIEDAGLVADDAQIVEVVARKIR